MTNNQMPAPVFVRIEDCLRNAHMWTVWNTEAQSQPYNPRNLPSCIVRVDCDIPGLNGLEQRDQFGWIVYKTWDYPMPDGRMFISEALGIDVMERSDDY